MTTMATVAERGVALRARPWRDRVRGLLRYAQLAPSTHNSQPWRVRLHDGGDVVEVLPDLRRRLDVVDPQGRELRLSCGAFVFHLRTAAAHYGFGADVEVFDEDDRCARVALFDDAGADDGGLFEAIALRRTCRQPFLRKSVAAADVVAVAAAAEADGARLVVVDRDDDRAALAALVSEADRLQWADPAFRAELAGWARGVDDDRRDGLTGRVVGGTDALSRAAPSVVRTFDLGASRAAADEELARGSPVLAVLVTDADHRTAWVNAGQALDRVLLTAASRGVAASFLNQCIEVTALRPQVSQLCHTCGAPQIVLRLGRPVGAPPPPTPRRPVDEILAEAP